MNLETSQLKKYIKAILFYLVKKTTSTSTSILITTSRSLWDKKI